MTPSDFRAGAAKLQAMQPDCDHWTFGGLQRGPDGRFKDEDLGKVLMDAYVFILSLSLLPAHYQFQDVESCVCVQGARHSACDATERDYGHRPKPTVGCLFDERLPALPRS